MEWMVLTLQFHHEQENQGEKNETALFSDLATDNTAYDPWEKVKKKMKQLHNVSCFLPGGTFQTLMQGG